MDENVEGVYCATALFGIDADGRSFRLILPKTVSVVSVEAFTKQLLGYKTDDTPIKAMEDCISSSLCNKLRPSKLAPSSIIADPSCDKIVLKATIV